MTTDAEIAEAIRCCREETLAVTFEECARLIERLAGELKAVTDAGFRIEKNVAHPFLGPTDEDRLTLWCIECGRDSGYHREDCSKVQLAMMLVARSSGVTRRASYG